MYVAEPGLPRLGAAPAVLSLVSFSFSCFVLRAHLFLLPYFLSAYHCFFALPKLRQNNKNNKICAIAPQRKRGKSLAALRE